MAATTRPKRTLLFRRKLDSFSGGHLKVWHYFVHATHSDAFEPKIHFTSGSRWDDQNPWRDSGPEWFGSWDLEGVGALFLGAHDWLAVPEHLRWRAPFPIFNIIQGMGHLCRGDPRHGYLAYPAIRICVNPVLAEAVRNTPHVRGPVLHIPMGIDDVGAVASRSGVDGDDCDILIAGMKAPELAQELQARCLRRGLKVRSLTRPLPRPTFLASLSRCRVAVLLPRPDEGFFLPAVEAMALGCTVVCVATPAICAYARHGENCRLARGDAESMEAEILAVLDLTPDGAARLRAGGFRTAELHSMDAERRAFLEALAGADEYWKEIRC